MSMGGFPVDSAAPVAPALHVDAFQNSLNAAGAAIFANPDAMAAALMQGLDGFRSQEANFHAAIDQAMGSEAPQAELAGPAAASATEPAPVFTPDEPSSKGMTTAELIHKNDAMEKRSLGLMMETYSFSLEATLVTNAATTFTSSINTLVKTQ